VRQVERRAAKAATGKSGAERQDRDRLILSLQDLDGEDNRGG